ncbi:hypothetical protein ACFLVE_03145 [Chloroflexota bacterium]
MLEKPLVEKPGEQGALLLSFVLKTKEGKYAPIEESSLPYSRLAEERETLEVVEEEYYYGIS